MDNFEIVTNSYLPKTMKDEEGKERKVLFALVNHKAMDDWFLNLDFSLHDGIASPSVPPKEPVIKIILGEEV